MRNPDFGYVMDKGIQFRNTFVDFFFNSGIFRTVSALNLQTPRLSDFTFTFHFHALEKEMATHSSILAWRIPGTEEPVGLPSVGSHRVGHD